MDHIQLIEFLSGEANDLLARAELSHGDKSRAQLEEAAELLALSANILKKHSQRLETDELRSAA